MARTTSSDRPLGKTCGGRRRTRKAGRRRFSRQAAARGLARQCGRRTCCSHSPSHASSSQRRRRPARPPATHVALDDGLEAVLVRLGQQLLNLFVLALLAGVRRGALNLRRAAHLRRRQGIRQRRRLAISTGAWVPAPSASPKVPATRQRPPTPGFSAAAKPLQAAAAPPCRGAPRRQPAALSAHLQGQRLACGPGKAPLAAAAQGSGAPPAAGGHRGHCCAHAAHVAPGSR